MFFFTPGPEYRDLHPSQVPLRRQYLAEFAQDLVMYSDYTLWLHSLTLDGWYPDAQTLLFPG